MRRRRRQFYDELGQGGFELTSIGDARNLRPIGEGVSCLVYAAEWRDREVAFKLYKAGAVERHARLLGEELVTYEYRRNKEFFEADGMRLYVAEPLAYFANGCVSAFVQEKLDGELYYHYYTKRNGQVPASLDRHLERIVELAHGAGLYDVDLHAGNVMVVTGEDGEPIPKLFDFNFIPFYVHAPNPAVWLGVRLGLIGLASRDRRKLKAFHDFRRVERKLAREHATSTMRK